MNKKQYQNSTKYELEDALIQACKDGNMDDIKYLLTSNELTEHPNISVNNNSPLLCACAWKHIDVVKYLLNSPDLKKKADVHAGKDIIFHYLLECKVQHILEYLILDMNVKPNKRIERFLKTFPNQQVENWFKVKDWNNEVVNGLENNPNKKQIKKTKL